MLLKERRIALSRYDIVQSYMIFGGVPFYLNYFKRGNCLAQNVDDLLFNQGAKLSLEYDRLFSSIFSNPEMTKAIVKVLVKRSKGYTRKEIIDASGYTHGGSLTKSPNALFASDFVVKYVLNCLST